MPHGHARPDPVPPTHRAARRRARRGRPAHHRVGLRRGERPDLERFAGHAAQRATLCLVNKRRAAHDLRRLRGDKDLREAAQRYARDMVAGGFFGHVSPGGGDLVDRLRASGFISPEEAWFVGENIAWGAGRRGTPRAIVRSWMNSPSHRANILQRRFRHVGIGVAAGAPRPVSGAAATYATDFGD